MALFCGMTLIFLVYRDLTIPEVGLVEVWFGVEVRGDWGRITAPVHWAIYGAGSLAFWRSWPPVWPLAIGYAVYIALSHLVWNLTSEAGGGLGAGVIQLVLFSIPALGLVILARSSPNRTSRASGPETEPSPRR